MMEPDNQIPQSNGYTPQNDLPAPPRILFWGLIVLFLMVIGGLVGGIVVFREVLSSGQQERVMNTFPFMETFLNRPPTPEGGILPTPEPIDNNDDASSLLDIQLDGESTDDDTGSASDLLDMDIESGTAEVELSPTVTEAAVQPTATSTATATPTLTPTYTSTPSPTMTPVPETSTTNSASLLPTSARMFGFEHSQQTWNNCGPATITMALSYYGWQEDQAYAADYLKPTREDKNVSPQEIVDFVNEQTGVRALARIGGNIDLLKTLIANNYPVIIETAAQFEGYDWIGHYRTLVAYDDVLNIFYAYDSFLGIGESGEGITITYAEQDLDWRAFNRVFIVVYPQEDEARIAAILGDYYSETSAAEQAFAVAQQEANANRQDAFAWFNMGTALTELGRYQEAATAFDRARQIGLPWRMLWYQFGPFEAYYQQGRYDDVLTLAQANLNNAAELEESYYWRGRALAAQGKSGEAATAFRTALRYNPRYDAARQALDALDT